MNLMDTDILIDYLRLYPPALQFFDGVSKKDWAISLFSHFELLQGCKQKREEQIVDRFIKHFKIIPLDSEISRKSLMIYHDHRWSIAMDIPDSFIAATALLKKCTLFTRNLKHYREIPSLKVMKPYD